MHTQVKGEEMSQRERKRGGGCEVESAYSVMEDEDPREDAEEVRGEQWQVDWGCTAPLHHEGHQAVQRKHAERITREQQPWEHKQHQHLTTTILQHVTHVAIDHIINTF